MKKTPEHLRTTIAANIRANRMAKFPGHGGAKKCAAAFGVSPQQWSPWERGMRTPDELRLSQIAAFFGVTVEYLRQDHGAPSGGEAFSLPPRSDRHAGEFMRSMYMLAERFLLDAREFGIVFRLHPDDIDYIVDRCLSHKFTRKKTS